MSNNSTGCMVALAAGGDSTELASQGLGIEHVEELMVQMAMKLLREGHQLTFGGALGDAKQPLTQYLIDAAQSWLGEESAKQAKITLPETWPLTNYSAWPYHKLVSAEQRARLVGICRFVNIDPPSVDETTLDELFAAWKTDPRARLQTSNALTALRKRSSQDAGLRVVWGGKIAGAAGWMAGILEEVGFTLERSKPLLILGGFGGCAGVIAKFLLTPEADWPDELGIHACADHDRDILLTEPAEKELEDRIAKVKKQLESFRKSIHTTPETFGVNSDLLKQALEVGSPRRAIRMAAEAAQQIDNLLTEAAPQ